MIVARDVPQTLLDLLNVVDYGRIPAGTMTIITTGLTQQIKHLPTKQTATTADVQSKKQIAADMPQKLLNVFNRIQFQRVPEAEYEALLGKLHSFITSGNVPLKQGVTT